MKWLLIVTGAFFLLLGFFLLLIMLAAAIAALFYRLNLKKSIPNFQEISQEAEDFINTALPAIVANWDAEELRKRATLKLLESAEPKNLDIFFESCSNLGHLQVYSRAKGQWSSSGQYLSNIFAEKAEPQKIADKFVVGNYAAEAEFEKGTAQIKAQIIRQDNQWFVNSLTVSMEGLTTTLGVRTSLEALIEAEMQKRKLEALLDAKIVPE